MSNQKKRSNAKTEKHSNPLEDPGLANLDSFTSNAKLSCFDALLYIFEDHGAVIQMIIKERSPPMKHVSRSHRVALDWLFDRINLDHQNRIRGYQNHLVDILTKGSFTREEWNHLLRLFNIINISKCSSGHFSPVSAPQTTSKRLIRKSRRR